MKNEWIIKKTAHYSTDSYCEGSPDYFYVEVSRYGEDEEDKDKVFSCCFVLLNNYEDADAYSSDAEYAYATINCSPYTRSQILLSSDAKDEPMLILEECGFTDTGKLMSAEEKGDCIMNALIYCLGELLYHSPEGLLFLFFREDEEEAVAFDLAQMSDEYMSSENHRMVITRNQNTGTEKDGYYRCYAGVVRSSWI